MRCLYALDVSAVVEELQVLAGSKLSKVYEPSKDELVLAFHTPGEGKSLLRILPGAGMYLADKKNKSPLKPFSFCLFLRKRIQNSTLTKIEQKRFERIVEFTFVKRDEEFTLIAEIFSKGNIVLCNKDGIILSALKVQHWKDRTIKAREKYVYPPISNANLLSVSFADFCRIINDSKKENIVKALAMDFGLGGVYAEEICARAQIDKKKSRLENDELKKIFNAIEDIRSLIKNQKGRANISEGEPFPFILTSKKIEKEFPNFNSALNFYYSQFIKNDAETAIESANSKLKEQKSILKTQKEQMKSIETSIEENTAKGNKIYENYVYIKEVLNHINTARSKGKEWKEIKKELGSKIIEIDEKNKKVVLELK